MYVVKEGTSVLEYNFYLFPKSDSLEIKLQIFLEQVLAQIIPT